MKNQKTNDGYRILFVLEHFYPYVGGAETLSYLLSRKLAAKGFEVHILTTLHDKKLEKNEIIDGVRIHRIDCRNRFLFTLRALRPAFKMAKNSDLIISSTYNAAIPAWWAAKRNSLPSILIFHEIWGKLWFRLPYLNLFQRIAYSAFEQLIARLNFTKVVAVSDYTKERLTKYFQAETLVRIYNGIDYREFEGHQWHAPGQFQPLFLGRLGVSKGIDLLIPAMDQFLDQNPESLFRVILPDQPRSLSAQIRQDIKALKHSERVILINSLPFDELLDIMCNSSCIIVPSYSEGFGFVAIEAAAMDIPVVSSGQGALKETVSGTYIEMKTHDAEGLHDALVMAKQGRWKITDRKQFSLNKSVSTYISLLEALILENNK